MFVRINMCKCVNLYVHAFFVCMRVNVLFMILQKITSVNIKNLTKKK